LSNWTLLLPILFLACFGILILISPKRVYAAQAVLALLGTAGALVTALLLFGKNLEFRTGWVGLGIDFDLRLYNFSSFIMAAITVIVFLTSLYSSVFMRSRPFPRMFFGFMLLEASFAIGIILANNLVLLLFFWAGMLGMLFALIMTGGPNASRTAVKAIVLNGVGDLCLVVGAGLAAWISGTFAMNQIRLPLDSFWNCFAYVMMMIGAVAKAGAFPFHSWIPDAAMDAPLPLMAFLPASLEKLLGIYLLTRVSLDLFWMEPGSALSIVTMIIGSCTILFAVMMALVQKDYKRLLAYHAVSQVGYMIVGVGTALPLGIVGGLFHMINNSMYKNCLYMTAGSVEKQAGTTDLHKLGGLGRKMPVTGFCFLLAGAAISGVPPFNGFFSKEMIFDAAMEINPVFFAVTLLGAFLTAASFLKLGHTVFFGKAPADSGAQVISAKEAPAPMLVPMVILALGCLLFGVINSLPLHGLIEPVLGSKLTESFAGLPQNMIIAGVSVVVLILAVFNHRYGVKKSGKASGAADHIHYAPALKQIYGLAEAGKLDPYNIGMKFVNAVAAVFFAIDRVIDKIVASLTSGLAALVSAGIRKVHTGQHWVYVLYIMGGVAVVAFVFIISK